MMFRRLLCKIFGHHFTGNTVLHTNYMRKRYFIDEVSKPVRRMFAFCRWHDDFVDVTKEQPLPLDYVARLLELTTPE